MGCGLLGERMKFGTMYQLQLEVLYLALFVTVKSYKFKQEGV